MGDDKSTTRLALAVAVGNALTWILSFGLALAILKWRGPRLAENFAKNFKSAIAKEMMDSVNPLAGLMSGLSSDEGRMGMGETGDIGSMTGSESDESEGGPDYSMFGGGDHDGPVDAEGEPLDFGDDSDDGNSTE